MLGQKGISVDVLESLNEVNKSPRGLAYGAPAVKVLARAGILEKTIERGFIPKDIAWRKPDGTMIVGFDRLETRIDGLPRSVILPVGSLSALLVEEAQHYPSIKIYWGYRVSNVGQDSESAWVESNSDDGLNSKKMMHADFVVGCDGGASVVRKTLQGGSFPGYTWPKTLVAVNAHMSFDKLGFSDVQWIIHPENWFVIAKIDNKGLWRIVYGEAPGLSTEEIRDRLPQRFRETLPGHPEPNEYQLETVTPYTVHQRCAEKMRVGRILLAGDAAHLNNPMGGLGLTTGVCDVGSLIDCLYGIDTGETSIDILDRYDEMRRQIFSQITDATSTANFHRVMADPETILEKDIFFQLLERAKTEPNVAAGLMKHEMSIGCDMTQYFANGASESSNNGVVL
ncbi:hypothetical protein LTS17_009116 [Exophiala oligosperma]